MIAAAPVGERRLSLPSAGLRLLHGWHLWSLDAPTVAACWTLLFCRIAHVAHGAAAATALACAVWLVYAADRLLDAARTRDMESAVRCELSRLYSERRGGVVAAAVPVSLVLVLDLVMLPSRLVEAWLLLAIPLLGYGLGVHLLGLPARWKAVCVGAFFGTAVVLPSATHHAVSAPLLLAAAVFGGVCRLNCETLSRHAPRFEVLLYLVGAGAIACMAIGGVSSVGEACCISLLLLAALRRMRSRLSTLTFRALADVALVLAPLVLLAV